jgi:ligand-binding sensor domain-containing protein
MGTEQNGIFRSTDNGFTWTRESPPATSFDPTHGIRDGNIYGMTFDRNGNVLFGSQGGIWKSSQTANGYTWTNVLSNHNTADGKGLGRDATGNLYYGHNHDTTDPTVVYRSTDDGAHWSAFDAGIPPSLEGHRFIVNPSDRKLYAVIEDGATNHGWIYCTANPVQ